MEFWNSDLTEKSWTLLQELKKEKWNFILIGGWATYLFTKQHKSKDIDIILPNFKDLEAVKQKYNLIKNDHLKKYEIKREEIDIDIYVPFYSKITLPIEQIAKETTKVEGFDLVKPEILLILKQGAEINRKESVKGQKDRIDIITLLLSGNIDFKEYKIYLKKYQLEHFDKRLKEIVTTFRDFKYINMKDNKYAKKKRELLKEL